MVKNKNKKGFARAKKVWHITDFRSLFELPDDLRKKRPGPLTFTKSPVTLTAGSKAPDIKHWERLQQLKSRPERHLLRSVFEDLKCWAGLKTIKDRGYLITTEGQPASYEYIAAQLKMEVAEIKKAMTLLEGIGLLERLMVKSGKSDSAGQGQTEADSSGHSRTKTDSAGRKRKPLKKGSKTNGNGKGNSKGNKKRLSKDKPKAREVPKPTTQPIKPQDFARGGTSEPFASPSELKNTQLVGDLAKNMLHKYNPQAKQFALEIYQALELPWDPMSETGRRELGCFAAVWHKAWVSKANFEVIEELRARAIGEAQKIGKRRMNKKRGAVWCHVFKNLLASRSGVQKVV